MRERGDRDIKTSEESYGEFSTFIDLAPEPMALIDAGGTVLRCNAAASRLLGRDFGELVNKPLSELVVTQRAGDRSPLSPDAIGIGLKGRAISSDGEEIPLELTVCESQGAGADAESVVFLHDLRGLHALEHRLRETDMALSNARELVELGAWEFDFDADTVWWSREMHAMLGLPAGARSYTFDSLLAYVHPADRMLVRERVALAREVGEMAPYESRWIASDGRTVTLSTRARLGGTPSGGPRRLVGVAHDVTNLRLAEEELGAFYSIAEGLAEWAALDETVPALLSRAARALNCVVATFWTVDGTGDRLRCAAFWADPELRPSQFENVTKAHTFARGEGMPGSTWSTRGPVVISDVASDPFFYRAQAAKEAGLRGALCFPVIADGRVLGCLELLSTTSKAGSPYISRTLTALGQQIGAFVSRRSALFGPSPITPREREVLQLAAKGLTGARIAAELVVSLSTIKTHFEKIYTKLGVSDRPAAVAEGFRRGLID